MFPSRFRRHTLELVECLRLQLCQHPPWQDRLGLTPPYRYDLNVITLCEKRFEKSTVNTDVETTLSPIPAKAMIVIICADCPDAVATAATPPSSAAIRFSKTSYIQIQIHQHLQGCLFPQYNLRRWDYLYGSRCAPSLCGQHDQQMIEVDKVGQP